MSTRKPRRPAGPVHRIVRELLGVTFTACELEGWLEGPEPSPGKPTTFRAEPSGERFLAATYVPDVSCKPCLRSRS